MSIQTLKKSYYLLVFVIFTACGAGKNQDSDVDLINGRAVNEAPAVVPLYSYYSNGNRGLCTGTFINDQEVITAAHCVEGASYIVANNTRSTGHIYNRYYSGNGSIAYDIALIKYPVNTSRYSIPLSNSAPSDGETLTLYGYGQNDYYFNPNVAGRSSPTSRSRSGFKQKGTNTYSSALSRSGAIVTDGYTQYQNGNGSNVSLGAGDSGGPMIVEGKGLVGIASSKMALGNTGYSSRSWHVDVNSTYSRRFFQGAKNHGFKLSNTTNSNPPVANPPVANPPVANPPVANPPVANGIYRSKIANTSIKSACDQSSCIRTASKAFKVQNKLGQSCILFGTTELLLFPEIEFEAVSSSINGRYQIKPKWLANYWNQSSCKGDYWVSF